MIDTVVNYLGQQSTWKGLIGLAAAAGITVSPELSAQIAALGMAAIGLINVLRNEKKKA